MCFFDHNKAKRHQQDFPSRQPLKTELRLGLRWIVLTREILDLFAWIDSNFGNSRELLCTNPSIPSCVDRTINCTLPPVVEGALITIINSPNPGNIQEYQTSISYSCHESEMRENDEPIKNITSFKCLFLLLSLWNVSGSQYGFVCNKTSSSIGPSGNDVACKYLTIPSCVDRHVYCTYPSMKNTIINSSPNNLKGNKKKLFQVCKKMFSIMIFF